MIKFPSEPAARKAAQRRAWSDLARDAGQYADRLIESEGELSEVPEGLREALTGLSETAFPSGEASARMAADAFAGNLRGLLTAALPRRRVILAQAVKAGATAIGELIVDTQETEALAWRAQHGEA